MKYIKLYESYDKEFYSYFINKLKEFDFVELENVSNKYPTMKFKNLITIMMVSNGFKVSTELDRNDLDFKVYNNIASLMLYGELLTFDIHSDEFDEWIKTEDIVKEATDSFLKIFLYEATININSSVLYDFVVSSFDNIRSYENIIRFWNKFYKDLDIDNPGNNFDIKLKKLYNLRFTYFPSILMPPEDVQLLIQIM